MVDISTFSLRRYFIHVVLKNIFKKYTHKIDIYEYKLLEIFKSVETKIFYKHFPDAEVILPST